TARPIHHIEENDSNRFFPSRNRYPRCPLALSSDQILQRVQQMDLPQQAWPLSDLRLSSTVGTHASYPRQTWRAFVEAPRRVQHPRFCAAEAAFAAPLKQEDRRRQPPAAAAPQVGELQQMLQAQPSLSAAGRMGMVLQHQ
ncbi:hypothetical protein PENTCL1PPCAC_27985, partial [Pristionchus entomophagus]